MLSKMFDDKSSIERCFILQGLVPFPLACLTTPIAILLGIRLS